MKLRTRLTLLIGVSLCLLWAGVASYPAHALEPQELLVLAEKALASATEWTTQSRIEVALPE